MADRFSAIAVDRPIGSAGSRQEGYVQGAPFDPPNCQGVTKAGINCSAPRALGTMFCIGHLRSKGGNVDRN